MKNRTCVVSAFSTNTDVYFVSLIMRRGFVRGCYIGGLCLGKGSVGIHPLCWSVRPLTGSISRR